MCQSILSELVGEYLEKYICISGLFVIKLSGLMPQLSSEDLKCGNLGSESLILAYKSNLTWVL